MSLTQTRLGFLVPALVVGGAERAIVFLANEAYRGGHDVDLVVGEADGPLREQVEAGVNVVELGGRGMVRGFPHLVRYLRRARPRARDAGRRPPR